jgi:hypothetical protein
MAETLASPALHAATGLRGTSLLLLRATLPALLPAALRSGAIRLHAAIGLPVAQFSALKTLKVGIILCCTSLVAL